MVERKDLKKIRVAVVHDWLVGMRGGENVLEAILELFPEAEVFTLVYAPDQISSTINKFKIHSSFLQKIPKIERWYRHFLPLMPFAISQFNLSKFDLVVSSSHCVAKGVKKRRGAVHVSYVHSPMRYMWDRFDDYFGKNKTKEYVRIIALALRPFFQWWDRRVSQFNRVNSLVANSKFIADQIQIAYRRKASVVYPFTALARFEDVKSTQQGNSPYYLVVSAFAPNKRVDLAIVACAKMGRSLKIVGSGQEEVTLRNLAKTVTVANPGARIEFMGGLTNEEITELFLGCKAFLFPGVDDFGITPVEAMAAGKPVIAYAKGGALETVTPDTGLFFQEPTADSLVRALKLFESNETRFTSENSRKRAALFSKERFQRELQNEIFIAWKNANLDPALLKESFSSFVNTHTL